jgi:hypothetical protein
VCSCKFVYDWDLFKILVRGQDSKRFIVYILLSFDSCEVTLIAMLELGWKWHKRSKSNFWASVVPSPSQKPGNSTWILVRSLRSTAGITDFTSEVGVSCSSAGIRVVGSKIGLDWNGSFYRMELSTFVERPSMWEVESIFASQTISWVVYPHDH